MSRFYHKKVLCHGFIVKKKSRLRASNKQNKNKIEKFRIDKILFSKREKEIANFQLICTFPKGEKHNEAGDSADP